MKVGIVGGGTVGRALYRALCEWYEVSVYDKDETKRTHTLVHVLNTELTFVCLPEGEVSKFFAAASPGTRLAGNWVIKSTTPVGFLRSLQAKLDIPNIVHSPEFLTARTADTDAKIPSVLVIGGTLNTAALKLRRLYEERYPGAPIMMMSSDESEAAKLMLNSVFAVKVALFNELYVYASKAGLDWGLLRATILADGRITAHHTRVPGPDGKFGFGGECLPKDLDTLVNQINNAHCSAYVTYAAKVRNELDRKRPT